MVHLLSAGDFDGALAVLTEMEYLVRERGIAGSQGLPMGAFSDILANCEISRVLLLMLLQVILSELRFFFLQDRESSFMNIQ